MSTTAQMSVHAIGLAPSGLGGRSRRDRSVFHRERASRRRVAHVASCSQSLVRSIGDRIRKGETSAEEVTRAYLAAIDDTNATIGSFVSVTADDAIAQAKAVDAALRAGEPLGLLAGIPLGVKDNIATVAGETSAGSKMWSEVHTRKRCAPSSRSACCAGRSECAHPAAYRSPRSRK